MPVSCLIATLLPCNTIFLWVKLCVAMNYVEHISIHWIENSICYGCCNSSSSSSSRSSTRMTNIKFQIKWHGMMHSAKQQCEIIHFRSQNFLIKCYKLFAKFVKAKIRIIRCGNTYNMNGTSERAPNMVTCRTVPYEVLVCLFHDSLCK